MFKKIDYFFLIAAFLSFLMSVGLWFFGHQTEGQYVGIWVPSILTLWVGTKLCVEQNKRRKN
ncbi:MAG: hypothetical protein P8L18_02570 [Verrucomicrobiota bacterium]|jgi:hypothetical protein|nr:hypothetical protein [Verrucomicrobiota bacterium]MDG1890169.1 hypothetical protein [Verrucomicrobiota bacterium]